MKNRYNFPLFNWHLEISSKCALKCHRCARTEKKGEYPVGELSLDFLRSIFPPEFLRANVLRITLCGVFGDPIYNSQFLEIVSYFKQSSPDTQLVIITNGAHRPETMWKNLAGTLNGFDEMIFSIDGWDQESNEKYRVNSNWDDTMKAVQIMAASPAIVRWSTIAFRYNQSRLDRIAALAETMGADAFSVTFSDRVGSKNPGYIDLKTGLDPLEPDPEFVTPNFQTQRKKVKFNRGKWKGHYRFYDTFNPIYEAEKRKVENNFKDKMVTPVCLYALRGAYIDIYGRYFPCCWISPPHGGLESPFTAGRREKFEETVAPLFERINLKERSLEDVINDDVWGPWTEAWKGKTPAVICEQKCGNFSKPSKPHP